MADSPRARVLTALNHQEPDRVPLALWGSWYGVTDKLYFAAMAELGWAPLPPFRPELLHSVNYYDDRLLKHLGVDIRHVDPASITVTSHVRADGSDLYGLRYGQSGLYRAANFYPLAEATVEEIMAYPLPDAEEAVREEPILARLKAIEALDEEYAVAGRAVASYGLFEMAQSLRKHDQLMMDLMLEPAIVHALVGRLYDCYAAMIDRFLAIAGHRLDLIELPGDDFAGNQAPIIAPKKFDEFFREPYTRLIQRIKARCPHIKVVYHSDGAVAPFLPRFVDMGVDVFHPLEPLPASDLAAIKAQFGDRLSFMGGIDIRQAMRGSREEVEREVKLRLNQLAAGGGYILAPSNHLQADVPVANLFALYETAQSFGAYQSGG
jgi:uroporphyrinogen decarboxylase